MQENLKFKFAYSALISELDSYKAHVEKVDVLLDNEVEGFEQMHQDIAGHMDNEMQAEGYLHYIHDEHWELSEKIPSIQRKAELISLYTILENGLNQVCHIFESNINNPVLLSDLSSNGIIDKSKKYLEKVALIKFPSGEGSVWEEITLIQNIRNAFVHKEGLVKQGHNDLIDYINGSQFLDLKLNEIIINKGFSRHCLQLFVDFFTSLFCAIDSA
jgi:hypothetical protein